MAFAANSKWKPSFLDRNPAPHTYVALLTAIVPKSSPIDHNSVTAGRSDSTLGSDIVRTYFSHTGSALTSFTPIAIKHAYITFCFFFRVSMYLTIRLVIKEAKSWLLQWRRFKIPWHSLDKAPFFNFNFSHNQTQVFHIAIFTDSGVAPGTNIAIS